MTLVDVSENARLDLVAIADFLSDFSAAAAYRFIETYERVLVDLRDFPDLGRENEDDPRTRVLNRGYFVFLYEHIEDRAILLGIRDGRRQRT